MVSLALGPNLMDRKLGGLGFDTSARIRDRAFYDGMLGEALTY